MANSAAKPLYRKVAATAASTGVQVAATGIAVSAGATSGAAAGTLAAVSSALTAAGIGVSATGVGLIVGGGLLAVAGITAIVGKYANKGRREAIKYAMTLGEGGLAFAREFADHVEKSDKKLYRRIMNLRGRIASKQAATGQLFSGLRDRRTRQLIDRLNADLMILQIRQKQPTQPLIANEPQTAPVVVANQPDTPEWLVPAAVIGGASLIGLALLWRS